MVVYGVIKFTAATYVKHYSFLKCCVSCLQRTSLSNLRPSNTLVPFFIIAQVHIETLICDFISIFIKWRIWLFFAQWVTYYAHISFHALCGAVI